MATLSPSSLDSRTLARRLGELASDERRVQVEFLLHLEEFDRRQVFLELGGKATIDRLRLLCRGHNLLHAEETYGREHMRKYRKGTSTAAGESSRKVPMAREAMAAG